MAAIGEIIPAIGILLTSVILARILSPKKWLLVDACITIAFAVGEICFPSETLSTVMNWKQDGYHWMFLQGSVSMMMMPSFVTLLTSSSPDVRVFKGLLLSRVVGAGMRLVLLVSAHFTTKGIFLDAHLYLAVTGVLGWFLVNAVQYWKLCEATQDVAVAPPLSTTNYWLLADAFWSFLGWGPDIFAPTIPLGSLDGLKMDVAHVHLFRVYGALNLGTCVVSVAAMSFSRLEDKCAVFKSRIVASLIILVVLTYLRTFYGVSPSLKEYIINAGASGPLLLGLGGLWAAANSPPGAKAGGKSQ